MVELAETFVRPVLGIVLAILRGLLWLGWEVGFHIIGWTVGWVVCKIVTFGHLPDAAYSDVDNVDFWVALTIQIIGLLVLLVGIGLLASLA